MWKSVFYKEWLKIRWFILLYALVGFVVIVYIYLKLKHSFMFLGAKNVWGAILFQSIVYFKVFRFIPLIGGTIIAFTQYLPEVLNKRIKLSFHLPLNENKILLLMQVFGALSLFISFLVFLILFGIIGLYFLPEQIVLDSLITIFPWILAGFSSYFIVSFLVLEPMWIYRFIYFLNGAFFISIHFASIITVSYKPIILSLTLMSILLSSALLFSGYRFRKGESWYGKN